MANRGWEIHFKGNPSHCELLFSNESLGCIPMVNYLCYLDVSFVELSGSDVTVFTPEFSLFVPAERTWDLWHARFGHLGGDMLRLLPASTQGVAVDSPHPQARCESCIIAKHPQEPYPSSNSPPTRDFLELIHSDICRPFPTLTIHGKQYFCCTRSARHSILFPFSVLTLNLCLRADGRCRTVQARLCCKRCRHVISLGSYLLSMTSSPFALAAVLGFSSFHFRFAPLISAPFAIRRWLPFTQLLFRHWTITVA